MSISDDAPLLRWLTIPNDVNWYQKRVLDHFITLVRIHELPRSSSSLMVD